jgi:hypothetical protein
MNQLSAARTSTRTHAVAALSAAAVTAIVAILAVTPAASAATSPTAPTPPTLPPAVVAAIASTGLPAQVVNGWEAVAGPAATIDAIQAQATTSGIGTIADYTGHDETGTAILVFTGNQQPDMGFGITGGTVTSADNDTNQTWYTYNDNDTLDATTAPGTAENIPPADLLDFTFNIGLNGGQSILGGQTFRL